jgi:hypothetical protein
LVLGSPLGAHLVFCPNTTQLIQITNLSSSLDYLKTCTQRGAQDQAWDTLLYRVFEGKKEKEKYGSTSQFRMVQYVIIPFPQGTESEGSDLFMPLCCQGVLNGGRLKGKYSAENSK